VIDHLTILAPGLLGASVAKAARARDTARHITLWTRRPETRAALRSQPFADAIAETPADAVRDANLIILAAPVEKIIELAEQISPALPPGALVTDVGSVKTPICEKCTALMPPHATFIGSHPMAGSDKTGWQNSTDDLFIGRTTFVTPVAQTAKSADEAKPRPIENRESKIENLCSFWRTLGSTPVLLTPQEHDTIVAHISHLPQALATTLASFLAQKNPQWRTYAGNGLRDTTRIAASDATMWLEIFQQNRTELLRALDAYQSALTALRAAIDKQDHPALRARLESGKKFRDSL